MELIEVNSKPLVQAFLKMPLAIYKNDTNWVRPLDQDIEAVFDPTVNKLFRDGAAIRWLLKDDKGNYIGRIAAFYNKKTARSQGMNIGGSGFFECINNQSAANTLFDAAKQWLTEKGMDGMDGPINFGERNQWWGCLYDGFYPPTYQMNYNQPYYNALFENYGFKIYFNQLVFQYLAGNPVPQKFYDKSERIARDPLYTFESIKKNNLEKYAEDLSIVYNEAWAKMGHFKPVNKQQTLIMLKKMKPIMDEDIIWFGYYNKKPIAFFVMLPEINQIVRHLNGQMNLWNKLKFAYHLWKGTCKDIFGVIFGVTPDHQGKGVESALIIEAAKIVVPSKKYNTLEMNWVGDFNPRMVKMVEDLEAKVFKRYRTYRFLFDATRPFERAPMV